MKQFNFTNILLTIAVTLSIAFTTNAQGGAVPDKIVPVNDFHKYSDLLSNYVASCNDVANQMPPNAQRLKTCITISSELLAKLRNFSLILKNLKVKIVDFNKWNSELDTDIVKNGVLRGHNEKIITLIKDNGGFRAVYDSEYKSLGEITTNLETEIKQLKALDQKPASISTFSGTTSYAEGKNYLWRCNSAELVAVALTLTDSPSTSISRTMKCW